jgi:hypothetical protein
MQSSEYSFGILIYAHEQPYTKIVEDLPQMRRETVQLVQQAVGVGRLAYVLVNNRAEGNAPLPVEGLVGMLRG